MNDQLHADPVIEALRSARPDLTDESFRPGAEATALLDEIVAGPVRRPRGRVAVAVSAVSIAAAITAAVVAVGSVGVHDGKVVVHQQVAAAEMRTIARTSAGALAASGRAEMTFDVGQGAFGEQRGTSRVAFSGENLDVVLQFDDPNGFTAHNKTVDGQYYLLDGAPNAKRWYHDIGATPLGSDLFDLDPRTLLAVLQPTAGFVDVGTEQTADGTLRHLRATTLGNLPALHLVLGPLNGRDITSLDLWVASDSTVRRLDLTSSHTETQQPACFVQAPPEGSGVKVCLKPGGKLSRTADGKITVIPGDVPAPKSPVTVTTTSSYSLRFSDIGAPISITAPADPIQVHGKG